MRKIIVMGSVGAVVLLVLAMFPSVVDARSVKSGFVEWFSEVEAVAVSDEQNLFFRDVDDTYGSGTWFPGYLILLLIGILNEALFSLILIFFYFVIEYLKELRNLNHI